jgi:tetratricopeptide (TPR) repeat protein
MMADLEARGRFAAQAAELTTADLAALESLGYAGGTYTSTASADEIRDAPDPKDMVGVLAMLHSATIAMEQRRHREAVDLLIQVASREDRANPRSVKMLSALILEAPEERPRILACLEEARRLERRAMDVPSLALLGVGFFAEEQYPSAIETFREVTRRAPLHAAAYRYLGDAHGRLAEFDEAARNYRRAIEIAARSDEPPEWLEHVRQQLDSVSNEAAEMQLNNARQ